jgi:hypothetical protein
MKKNVFKWKLNDPKSKQWMVIVSGELSQHLISSFKYLGPHFHSFTADLGIVNMSMHGNNGESFELRMHLFFFHTRKHHRLLKASRFQHGNDETPIDGSRLNTDSTWQFLYNNNLMQLSL